MRDRLIGTPQPTIMLILSAEETASQDAGAVLHDFLQSTAPLPEWMDDIARLD